MLLPGAVALRERDGLRLAEEQAEAERRALDVRRTVLGAEAVAAPARVRHCMRLLSSRALDTAPVRRADAAAATAAVEALVTSGAEYKMPALELAPPAAPASCNSRGAGGGQYTYVRSMP